MSRTKICQKFTFGDFHHCAGMGLTTVFWLPLERKQKQEAKLALDCSLGILVTMPYKPHLAEIVLILIPEARY